jgi:hypothetical protein
LAIISPDELVSQLHDYNDIRLSKRSLLRYEKEGLVAAAERGRTGRGKGRGHACNYSEDAYYDAVAACRVFILVNISHEELADLRARALQKLQEQCEGERFAVQSEAEEMWLFYREFLRKFWEIGGDFVIAKYPELDKKRDGEPVYASVRCVRTRGDKPIQYLADLTGTDDRYIDTVDVKDIFYDMLSLQKNF